MPPQRSAAGTYIQLGTALAFGAIISYVVVGMIGGGQPSSGCAGFISTAECKALIESGRAPVAAVACPACTLECPQCPSCECGKAPATGGATDGAGKKKWARCPDLPADKLVLNKKEIIAYSQQEKKPWGRYEKYCCLNKPLEDDFYRKFFFSTAGKEHYALLGYMANKYAELGGAVMIELGSREGASSLALGSHPKNSVYSFDISSTADNIARVMKTRGYAENPTREDVQLVLPNIHYIIANVTDRSKPNNNYYRNMILSAPFLLLDTHHYPETHPFEYGFIEFLDDGEYTGVVFLDDIYLNDEMKRFWGFLVKKYGSDRAIDITSIGHASGTGLLDFCGNTKFVTD
eukprot:TRINITY_DN5041_c0_g1_i1.p1 TRINITY_DN5041_c0_g1~~TRINITY_DN5041_c0_g1_i1.p1  ORF type:complete len:348 (+),score=95.33 TRINITY_DN5041_c0_g1_i1:64-1107(+)